MPLMVRRGARHLGRAGWVAGLCVVCCAVPLLASAGVLAVSSMWFGGLAAATVAGVIVAVVLFNRWRNGARCETGKRGAEDERSADRVLR